MENLSVKFAFGGALGRTGKSFSNVSALYLPACVDAAKWLADTPTFTDGHGWLDLPDMDVVAIKETGNWLKGYDAVIHVGIGGSALGSLMLNQALLGEYINEGVSTPKFYLADNPDPTKTQAIWERVKDVRVALVGVSKSGATAETMSQFLWFRNEMLKRGGDISKDILVITDPEKGIFRAFARSTSCRVLDLPPSVGGRYSVLSAAGLVSAYALGIEIDGLLLGAKLMRAELIGKQGLDSNPAWMSATLHCFHEKEGRSMSVLMPYSSKLAFFAEWYAQLWGESLGKNGMGTTPVRAVGAIDQHSQVQLYTDGPDDKLFTIINLKKHGAQVLVPPAEGEALAPLSYLNNAEIGNMLGLEAMSTAAAIVRAGHPLIWIEIGELNEVTLGALIFFYEYMTAMTGRMMGIDPFDQPGVEQGKKYTYGLMGREGFEKDAQEARKWFSMLKETEINIG